MTMGANCDALLSPHSVFTDFRSSMPSWGIPNHGERLRHVKPISTALVESTVNHVVSKRSAKRQRTPRSALQLLQALMRVLNNNLGDAFKGWCPGFHIKSTTEGLPFAAVLLRFCMLSHDDGDRMRRKSWQRPLDHFVAVMLGTHIS